MAAADTNFREPEELDAKTNQTEPKQNKTKQKSKSPRELARFAAFERQLERAHN